MGGASGYIISFSDEDPFSLTLRWCRNLPLKCLSSRTRTSCSDQLADSVIRCGYPVRSRKALLEEEISAQHCCICRAVIVRESPARWWHSRWVCVTLGEIPHWRCAQRGWMLALRVFQSCLFVLAVSFLFRRRLHPSRPPVFFLPGICEKKQRAEDLSGWWQASTRRLNACVPRRLRRGREHSPVLFTQHDQRPSAVSDMNSFDASDVEIDDSLFFWRLRTRRCFFWRTRSALLWLTPPSYRHPLHVTPDSEWKNWGAHPHHDKGCQWARAQMVSAEEPSRSRLDECFFTGRYQAPPPTLVPLLPRSSYVLTILWHIPHSSRIRPSASAVLTSVDSTEEKGYEHLPLLDESVDAHLCLRTAIGY